MPADARDAEGDRIHDLERALAKERTEASQLRVAAAKAGQALERLAEAERALARVPDLERQLRETTRERNELIMELERRPLPPPEATENASGLADASGLEAELERLRTQVQMMESTRLWRLGAAYWRLRARARAIVRSRARTRGLAPR